MHGLNVNWTPTSIAFPLLKLLLLARSFGKDRNCCQPQPHFPCVITGDAGWLSKLHITPRKANVLIAFDLRSSWILEIVDPQLVADNDSWAIVAWVQKHRNVLRRFALSVV